MGAALAVAATAVTGVSAQNAHPHTPGVSGVAGGVPYFCASPTTTSTTSGAWSDARTWSNGRVPGRDDKVAIAPGHTVTYGITADVDLNCIEVGGTLAFATDVDTRMRVGTIMVLENGALELGTVAQPMQADATSVIEIVDRPFSRRRPGAARQRHRRVGTAVGARRREDADVLAARQGCAGRRTRARAGRLRRRVATRRSPRRAGHATAASGTERARLPTADRGRRSRVRHGGERRAHRTAALRSLRRAQRRRHDGVPAACRESQP